MQTTKLAIEVITWNSFLPNMTKYVMNSSQVIHKYVWLKVNLLGPKISKSN